MRPILLDIELFGSQTTLRAYSTFMVLAWIAAVAVGAYAAYRLDLPWRKVLLLLATSLAIGIVGARVFDLGIAGDFYADDPSRIWAVGFSGFSLYGGLLSAGLTGLLLARRWRIPVWRLADAAVPGIAAGIVLMRTGCFLSGCCFGKVTSMPWGVSYGVGSPAWAYQIDTGRSVLAGLLGTVLPVHPTQLYEMLVAVLLALLALALLRRRVPDGVPFLVFAIGFTLFRLGNDFLRVRQPVITAPEWFYPVFYSVIVAVFTCLFVARVRTGRHRP